MKNSQQGFSIVELLVAIVIFPLLMIGIVSSYNSARHIYQITRQMNEMYIVLSSCPELDRGLEFNSLSSSTNCYPNNTFPAEDGGKGTISYAPSLTVTDTTSLAASDPLQSIPDSKVVEEIVNWPAPNASLAPLRVRMLITRNGIGQQ
ncbi:MAG: prepilin-type N-terminal cleavage/methylation domain-containing protein [Patescibacteria group bacterium]|nr:prepilin-type N-terminal cleavage/methylation domain-containing protein [Patescibacteria group bacterium]